MRVYFSLFPFMENHQRGKGLELTIEYPNKNMRVVKRERDGEGKMQLEVN